MGTLISTIKTISNTKDAPASDVDSNNNLSDSQQTELNTGGWVWVNDLVYQCIDEEYREVNYVDYSPRSQDYIYSLSYYQDYVYYPSSSQDYIYYPPSSQDHDEWPPLHHFDEPLLALSTTPIAINWEDQNVHPRNKHQPTTYASNTVRFSHSV